MALFRWLHLWLMYTSIFAGGGAFIMIPCPGAFFVGGLWAVFFPFSIRVLSSTFSFLQATAKEGQSVEMGS